jgi:nucleoside phosphorylase
MPDVQPPVDFAVVTALAVERAAVVQRLDAVEKLQFDDEPLTFYVGTVTIPGESTPYSVVVTQLTDMGNADAAIAATRVIQRWKPRQMLMVGIAGGVREKVALGDVVVSQFAFYYEPGKLTPAGVESRARDFNSDSLLYARAQHFEALDWKGQIGTLRPDATDQATAQPAVHFGPIACGEKVIADLDELNSIRKQCPKMVAVAMEGAGVAKAVLSDAHPPRYLEIRGISDYAGPDKNDGWHEYAANSAAAFAIGFLRDRPLAPGPPPDRNSAKDPHAATLVLSAQSLRTVSADEAVAALSDDLKQGELQVLPLDWTDLVENKVFAQPDIAARRLTDPHGPLFAALAQRADANLVFLGLAAIPPVVLAGHIVTDRRFVRLYDFHPEAGNWSWPNAVDYPLLECNGLPKRPLKRAADIFVRMAVSYPVNVASSRTLGLNPALEVDLSLASPVRGVVQSEDQVRAYGRAFRELLDQLSVVMPYGGRVHLFYAGPMALAFHLGQQISENIHPPVAVWNYSRGYEWAIDLRAAVSGEPCILRPATPFAAP